MGSPFVIPVSDALPGKLLIFVHYGPNHRCQDEWVWNAAHIDASRVIWARDLGAEENKKLMAYYPRRAVFVLEPDGVQPKLARMSGDVLR